MTLKFFFYIVIQILVFANVAFSQKKDRNNYKVADHITMDSSTIHDGHIKPEFRYQFHNINRILYYENQSHKRHIQHLEETKEYDKLLPELRNYVLSFGIKNFYTEPEMIWKVAQLSELQGLKDDAIYFYRLVLKHYRGKIDIEKVKLNYDTLAQNVDDKYVSLKFYYELVEYRKAVDTLRPPRGVFLKLSDAVNSKSEDYAPTLNMEANMMIFSSRRKKSNNSMTSAQLNEDIYMSKSYDGVWDETKFMDEINTPYNEGSACLTKDAKTLYFSRCMAPRGIGNCDLYVSHQDDEGKWGTPKNLGTSINSVAWDSQPSLSHSEDTLFFASDRIGGFGLSDIYYSVKLPDGSWSVAKNMGPIINTRENEVSPFMHPVYDVLYFSSTGHMLRFGDFDIFKSRKVNGVWLEPKSIGPLVNGAGSEYYFTIDSQSKNLYYARTEEGSKDLDIFSFPLPMEAQPNAVVSLQGTLTDSATGNPYKGIVTVIDMTNGIEVAPKELRSDGSYSFDLIDDADYLLIIQGEDFFRIEQKIHMNGDTSIKIKVPSIRFKSIQFTSVNFENDKANILPEMHSDLDKIFNYMVDNPEVKLVISGHTDGQGDPKKNIDLSQRRADAIKKYIMREGVIDNDRITAIGYGSSKPIREELTMEDRTVNRRVEFQIIKDHD